MHFVIDARTLTLHFPGIGRYVQNLLLSLPPLLKADEHVTALVNRDTIIPEGINRYTINDGPLSLKQHWSIPAALKNLKPDLFHSPYFVMPYRINIPCALTVHDLIPLLFPKLSGTKARLGFRSLMNRALQNSSHVICVSKHTQQDLLKHFKVPEKESSVIPLAAASVFKPLTPATNPAFQAKYKLPPRFILYVGSGKPHKNLGVLLTAWHQIKASDSELTWQLILAGPELNSDASTHKQIKALKSRGHLTKLNRIPDEDLPSLYNAAELFVFPSLYEGFGLPVLEAMACGLPVICAQTGSLPEVAGPAARYFDPKQPNQLKAILLELMQRDDLRKEMAQASSQRAATFSWETTAQQTLKHYRTVANSK